MKFIKANWYSLDHNIIKTKFEGSPDFLNEFCVYGEYNVTAVYKVAKPNKNKKHKKYFLLTKSDGQWYVRGMSPIEMKKHRYQPAIHCLTCDEVIYSANQHHYNKCSCQRVGIDGGKAYTRTTYAPGSPFKMVTLDLLTNKISDPK